MKKWQIELIGQIIDIDNLYKNQESESWSIVKVGEKFYLESTIFKDLLSDDKVKIAATRLIESINGSAMLKIHNYRSIELGNVSQLDKNNHRKIFFKVSGESRIGLTSSAEISSDSIDVPNDKQREKPDLIKSTFTLSQNNRDYDEALQLFSKNKPSWYDLYKIYDIVRDNKNLDEIRRDAGISNTMISKFTQTCQYTEAIGREARHARMGGEPPSNPMEYKDAYQLIKTMLIKWEDLLLK